ncbi:MAG: phytanoyl-CoA dioxygenase family protein [Bacteroidota bacterium]
MARLKDVSALRFFSGDKIVDAPLLNRMGMQVARAVTARTLFNLRPADVHAPHRGYIDQLRSDGVFAIPDFLPGDQFERLRAEAMSLLDQAVEHEGDESKIVVYNVGTNRIEFARINAYPQEELPELHRFIRHEDVLALFTAAEKRPITEKSFTLSVVERLIQGPRDNDSDRETNMHSDVFFDTHKAWLYLDDVEEDDGPFGYVKSSQRMSPKRLGYVYDHSLQKGVNPARRITQEELRRRKLTESVLTAKKNTLVMANTTGYHRRLPGVAGGRRHAIHLVVRANPFMWWQDLAQSH